MRLGYKFKTLKKYFTRKMTHLDPKSHSIFSLNEINTQPVDGLFLSLVSVMHLLSQENEFRVTEELFVFNGII